MKRPKLRRSAAACLALGALLSANAPAGAQTWRWNYVTRTPNTPPLAAESTVSLSGGRLHMLYTVPLLKRQVVIESCQAAIADVESATTVNTQGRTYLLVQLKPTRAAACKSGSRPAVALPTDDERYISGVVSAINRSCCSGAPVAASVPPAPHASKPALAHLESPSPRPTAAPAVVDAPSPAPMPAPSPSATPDSDVAVADWVEVNGSYAFVRVSNTGATPVRIRDVAILDCRKGTVGCGRPTRSLLLDPHGNATIATIAVTPSGGATPAFRYRYVAAHGSRRVARSGAADSGRAPAAPPLSAQGMRVAAAGFPAGMPTPDPATQPGFIPPRLIKRGSSRLAIGVTGTALVRVMIGANGTPQEATIVTISNRTLAAAAIETAVSSTFTAATQNGKPVDAKYIATFTFDGEDPALAGIPMWKRSPSPAATAPASVPTPSAAPTPLPQAAPAPEPSAAASPLPAAPSPLPSTAPQPIASP